MNGLHCQLSKQPSFKIGDIKTAETYFQDAEKVIQNLVTCNEPQNKMMVLMNRYHCVLVYLPTNVITIKHHLLSFVFHRPAFSEVYLSELNSLTLVMKGLAFGLIFPD
ncbi:hypothetical protein FKM82_008844 [Ascaphus truei]